MCCVSLCLTCSDHALEAAGLGFKRKRRKRLQRPLSSGESEDDVGEEGRWGRRGSRRRVGRRRSSAQVDQHQDDGDEELFRLRIRWERGEGGGGRKGGGGRQEVGVKPSVEGKNDRVFNVLATIKTEAMQ